MPIRDKVAGASDVAGSDPDPVTWSVHPCHGVLDFIRRGQRAQPTVDAILAVEPERRRTKWPRGRA